MELRLSPRVSHSRAVAPSLYTKVLPCKQLSTRNHPSSRIDQGILTRRALSLSVPSNAVPGPRRIDLRRARAASRGDENAQAPNPAATDDATVPIPDAKSTLRYGVGCSVSRRDAIALGAAAVLLVPGSALAEDLVVQTETEPLSQAQPPDSSSPEPASTPPEPPSEPPAGPEPSSPPTPPPESPSPPEPPSKPSPGRASRSPDTTITDKVYFDFTVCPNAARVDRTLGDPSLVCSDGESLGRVVVGLYGKQVPQTVHNFKAMVTGEAGSSYKSTVAHKILQGQYVQFGRQGNPDRGEVLPPKNLEPNSETILSSSFKLKHSRGGIVSLCLAQNDDDEARKLGQNYRNVEFLITTGPGPAPDLDDNNIVFGTVLEGLDVISKISSIPTYQPSEKIRQFNDLAEFFGDERAMSARMRWNSPLKSIVISDCGIISLTLPPLPPFMP